MQPVVDRLQTEYADRIDFYVYGEVNSDPAGSQFANDHGVTAIPTMMIVASDGTETARIVGARSESEMRTQLDAALAE